MTVSLKHKFTSAKADGADSSLVRPSNWNDEHDLTLAADRLLGRATAGTGAVEEITCTAAGRALLDDADATAQRATLAAAGTGVTNAFTGDQYVSGSWKLTATTSGDRTVKIGDGRTGNGFSYIDLIGDATYTDYGLRIIRGDGGANTYSQFLHRGTGDFLLWTFEAAPIVFYTSSSERMRITSAGKVGIGTSSPNSLLTISGADSSNSLSDAGIAATLVNTDSGAFGRTMALNFNVGDSSAASRLASIVGIYTTYSSSGGGALAFLTNNGSGSVAERMRIDNNGNVIVTAAGGLGYGTGSGGSVTQASSRTTGVTLNKTNGAITLVSAAGSTTPDTFTVTNSAVAATDTVILSQKSGANKYDLMVSAVAAGSFNITLRSADGTATEAPVINFAVIKAVTS